MKATNIFDAEEPDIDEKQIMEIAYSTIKAKQDDCPKDASERDLYYLMAYNDGAIAVAQTLINKLKKKTAEEENESNSNNH